MPQSKSEGRRTEIRKKSEARSPRHWLRLILLPPSSCLGVLGFRPSFGPRDAKLGFFISPAADSPTSPLVSSRPHLPVGTAVESSCRRRLPRPRTPWSTINSRRRTRSSSMRSISSREPDRVLRRPANGRNWSPVALAVRCLLESTHTYPLKAHITWLEIGHSFLTVPQQRISQCLNVNEGQPYGKRSNHRDVSRN